MSNSTEEPLMITQSPTELELSDESWHVTIRKVYSWVTKNEESSNALRICLITDPEERIVLKQKKVYGNISAPEILNLILEAIFNPEPFTHKKPHRPQSIIFDDSNLANELTLALKDIAIKSIYQPTPFDGAEEFGDLEEVSTGFINEFPGLLSIPGIEIHEIAHLFSSAAEFYRTHPWTVLSDKQPVEIHFSSIDQISYIQLLGKAGIQYGFILHRDYKSLIKTYSVLGESIYSLIDGIIHSLTFENEDGLPQADREAIKKFKWEIAGVNAYPFPCTYMKDIIERPAGAELLNFDAAMRAICAFMPLLIDDGNGDYFALEERMKVATPRGEMPVFLRYPVRSNPRTD
jgi:hypothetical protein